MEGVWVTYTGEEDWDWEEWEDVEVLRVRVAPDVTEIPEAAFDGFCENLREVQLNEGLQKIGANAFESCTLLERIDVPSTVVEIGSLAFESCFSLKAVELREGLERIGSEAFQGTRLKRLVVPSSVTSIGEYAFYSCTRMIELTFRGGGLPKIERGAFQHCVSLGRVALPPSIAELGCEAFEGCTNLREVELCKGLQSIGSSAFKQCTSLERVAIPSTVIAVGESAFRSCQNLSEVVLGEGVLDIEHEAFLECTSLHHLSVSSTAIVVRIRNTTDCQLITSPTIPIIEDPEGTDSSYDRMVVISKCLRYMAPSYQAVAENRVLEILRSEQQTNGEKNVRIRSLFAYYELLDITSTLELCIWKASMNAGSASDTNARQACRINCGRDVRIIIEGILPYIKR